MRVTIICARCGESVERNSFPSQPAPRYCSQQCWLKAHNTPERNAAVARATVAARAERQRDTGEGKSYRKWFGRHEHRVIVERILGRSLSPDDIVHHKDGNKRNNDPANLEVTNRADHARHHLAPWWGLPLSDETKARIRATKQRQRDARVSDAVRENADGDRAGSQRR